MRIISLVPPHIRSGHCTLFYLMLPPSRVNEGALVAGAVAFDEPHPEGRGGR